MTLKQWKEDHTDDITGSAGSEEDIKVKIIVPYLKSLGYAGKDLSFERGIPVSIGRTRTTIFPDIVANVGGCPEIIVDTKPPTETISEKDVLQAVSYAKLVSTPPALYGIVTNGTACVVTNVYTGKTTTEIPTVNQVLREADRTKRVPLREVEIKEVESVLYTIENTDTMYRVIGECKDLIEKRGLIRSDQSFREMTKIILVKMNEERRVRDEEGDNRFSVLHLTAAAQINGAEEIEVFRSLLTDAEDRYPDIYTRDDDTLRLSDNECVMRIVEKIERFSFLGTGDDVKGAVYEIFLKSTLRGDFDQYFTPREIVDFIVRAANPGIGDVLLDPACGSGGFLIRAFRFVNAKIESSGLPATTRREKFNALTDKCLWGHEADYDLHILAKINMIMHGDGWNNIFQGDSLKSESLPDGHFDFVLTNPPFTLPYSFPDVLSRYELGDGKTSEELDVLFVEKSVRALKPGGELFIVLPEGLMNNRKYLYFREWLLDNTDLLLSVSLPEGAFIPFGGSVSKTCVLGVRKKGCAVPKHVFLGRAAEVGYETGKKAYRENGKNELVEMLSVQDGIFPGVRRLSFGGQCGWAMQSDVTPYRMDANYLLNGVAEKDAADRTDDTVPLGKVCEIQNETVRIDPDGMYQYLEVPDISDTTGAITNIRKVRGKDLTQTSYYMFRAGDILFVRINPRISRIAIVPPIDGFGITSKEVYRIAWKPNSYIAKEDRYCLCPILRSDAVRDQFVRIATGSSSSRARVPEDGLMRDVRIRIPDGETQRKLSEDAVSAAGMLWEASQRYLDLFVENGNLLGDDREKGDLRKV